MSALSIKPAAHFLKSFTRSGYLPNGIVQLLQLSVRLPDAEVKSNETSAQTIKASEDTAESRLVPPLSFDGSHGMCSCQGMQKGRQAMPGTLLQFNATRYLCWLSS